VRTYTDLATMEAANEAARRATNGILAAARSDQPPCAIWKLHEPEVLVPLRAYDRQRFNRGLAWDGTAVELAQHAVALVASATSLANVARGSDGDDANRMVESAEQLERDAQELTERAMGARPFQAPPPTGGTGGTSAYPRVRILPE
jgi:hypothetical protein